MKKVLFILAGIACCSRLMAQPVITGTDGHVKLDDVIATYKQMHPDYGQRNYAKALLPGLSLENSEKHHLFDRWLWYWRLHTDENGYLVSAAQTWQEWEKIQAQHKAAKTTSGAASWQFVGPDSSEANGEGVGRVNMVAFHPTDTNTYWVGAAGGGAWKTTNNGHSWTCMTDQLPVLAVSDIVINPLNPNTIYLCTGDRDGGDYSGIGVLKSYDGGATWLNTGITWTPSQQFVAKSIVMNPLDTNTLVLATSAGMYITHNGGTSFTRVAIGDFNQVLYHPADTGRLYATTLLSFGGSTPSSAQIWRSVDAGNTWTQQTSMTQSYRITLAVTPAAPNMVLAISAAFDPPSYTNFDGLDGIYKSSDTGNTFTEIYTGGCGGNLLTWAPDGGGCGGQGSYTLPLAISPVDSNLVYTGGVNTWRSTDGGVTWTLANQESPSGISAAIIHADKHWMAFHPLKPARLFETNDGGIYYSDNPVASGVWNNVTNRMGIEEIYRTAISEIASFAITGAQDVGSKLVRPGGHFEQAFGDDGMTCQLDFADSTVAYASGQYGIIGRLDPTASNPVSTGVDISANIPGGVEGNGDWVTPFVIEPSCHTCLLAGYGDIYRSTDKGITWNAISSSMTTNNLYKIATSITDSNTIFAVESQYGTAIHYTHDKGASWSSITSPYSGYHQITDIAIDPRDNSHIWLTYGGYTGARVAEWRPSTGFQSLATGLPNVPVYSFAFDYLSRDMYVGTEIGVFYRDSTMASWVPFNTGMPSVRVSDLKIKYSTNELWAATYGRSLWKSPKHTTTNAVMNIVPFAPDGVLISPNPNRGSFTATLKNTATKQVTMSLVNSEGRSVWQGNGTVNGNKIDVNANGIIAGTYIFEIRSGSVIIAKQKVVIY